MAEIERSRVRQADRAEEIIRGAPLRVKNVFGELGLLPGGLAARIVTYPATIGMQNRQLSG
jgi:hypothetical protein